MARRKDSPQKAAMREMMRDYLKNNDISIKDGTDVNSIMASFLKDLRMFVNCWRKTVLILNMRMCFTLRF